MKKTSEEYSMLYDYYGALLSVRQREVFDLYHEENLSLSEIADSIGVSRQAVHIALGKATEDIAMYEEKLGLVAKRAEYMKAMDEIEKRIDGILKDKMRAEAVGADTARDLKRIKKLIKELDI